MKVSDLPRLGVIKNYDPSYIQRLGALHGKSVLCVGYSEAQIDEFIAPLEPEEVQVLTLWDDHIDARAGKYKVTIGDISKRTTFDDETFDAIATLSVLEHVSPLEGAFSEMNRLTKRGGYNFHMFGPAWSSAYGSHLYVEGGHDDLDFSRWRIPAYMHLLASPSEIYEHYVASGFPSTTAGHVVHSMFSDPFINRVFYDEYARLMSKYFVVENAELMTTDTPEEIISALRQKYPGANDFDTYGGKYVLRKR